jgi:hypothetical protein
LYVCLKQQLFPLIVFYNGTPHKDNLIAPMNYYDYDYDDYYNYLNDIGCIFRLLFVCVFCFFLLFVLIL